MRAGFSYSYHFVLTAYLLLAIPSACSPAAVSPGDGAISTGRLDRQELTVFAAASLTEAFSEIGERFEAENPEVELIFNFAGSQQLSQQLAQGAAADVFASADHEQMNAAIRAGRIAKGDTELFAHNSLVVV
jgi:molybdate transport system substrate-binding protein